MKHALGGRPNADTVGSQSIDSSLATALTRALWNRNAAHYQPGDQGCCHKATLSAEKSNNTTINPNQQSGSVAVCSTAIHKLFSNEFSLWEMPWVTLQGQINRGPLGCKQLQHREGPLALLSRTWLWTKDYCWKAYGTEFGAWLAIWENRKVTLWGVWD